MMKVNFSQILKLISVILLIVNVSALVWYIFYGYQASFHSDSAAKVIIAREIFETGSYFPPEWNYVNNDLFVFFGHTFIIPLLYFMPAGFGVHAISGLISSTLILTGIWLITGIAQISLTRRILVIAILAASISGFMAENLYGQVSYGNVIFFSCYWLFFSYKFIESKEGQRSKWGFALLLVVIITFWSNPQRALITFCLPFIAATVLQFWNEADGSDKRKFFPVLSIVFCGLVLGWVLHLYTLKGVNSIVGAGQARWLSYDLMVRNFSFVPKGLLAIFGGLPTTDALVVTKNGVYEALRLFTAIAAIVLIPAAVYKSMMCGVGAIRTISSFVAFSFMAVIFLQIATSIPDMSDPIQSSRYLIPSLLLGLVILLISPVNASKSPLSFVAVASIFIMFGTSSYPAMRLSGPSSNLNWGMQGQINADRQAVVDFLIANKLNYGYATYWNAGALSVLSNEKSLVRQIAIEGGIPVPMRHLSSNRWYRPAAWLGSTFLLLTDQEASAINWNKMLTFGLTPSKTLNINGFKVFVFGDNISKHLPGWDTRFESQATFLATKYSLHQTGKFVDDAKYGKVLVAEKGDIGALHYGPYINVEKGRYVVTFDVDANQSDMPVARLDIAASPDQKLYGEAILKSSNKPYEINFKLDTTRTIEFRVWALGTERVVFKSVSIRRLGDNLK